ncbi:uncharacterized protein LOC125068587 [Vanessa atalanta]|uniref:uncharacterized protein LOC125068587 n=1 Tax=Vanessa atalanta TaxID=42275 RepID=UPI001FCCE503|nr:uncharacterized protein LOC125068587 [Vanessa atalanta]
MIGVNNIYCLSIVFFVFLLKTVCTEDICVAKGPCSCVFSNGTGIDLSLTIKATFYSTQSFKLKNNGSQYELSTYFYHPCTDVLLKVNSTATNNSCDKPLSICRHKTTLDLVPNKTDTFKTDGGNYEFLGRSNVSQFSADGKSITYFNGPSLTLVTLVCAQTDDQLQVVSLVDPDNIVLSFYSRQACLKLLEEEGRSFGSTLLIIFFSFVILYLVLGICTKKFLMGATGIEVVPNLTFWSDLPNLVKDGWAFAINGFKLPTRGAGPVTSPDPNSYDSI